MGLRVRRADAAPGVGLDEYFGRLGETVITDRDCSDEAKVLLAAIYLDMVQSGQRVVSLATNQDLADLVGKTPRTITRRLAELEARKHLARERVRTIAGSPRGLRPLSKLRGVRRPSDPSPVSRCNPSPVSMHLDTGDHAPSQPCPGDSTPMATPLKREGENPEQQQERGPAADVVVAFSPQGDEDADQGDAPSRANFLGRIVHDLADAFDLGAQKSPGVNRQVPPGASESRDSVPDERKCTGNPATRQDRKMKREHNSQHKSDV